MPYILYKTDGTKLTTVDDASLDLTTDLSLVGKNYSGYGQVVNENFVALLENFSSDTAPAKPLRGQLWYDKINGRLNVSYDGKSFKGIASIFVQSSRPPVGALVRGDLWWDSDAFQLKAFDGGNFQVIGPFDPASGRATWLPDIEETGIALTDTTPVSKGVIDDEVIAILGRQDFIVQANSPLVNIFPQVKRGITLKGADSTGNSVNSGTVLWGSAAHAVYATSATTATFALNFAGPGAPALLSSTSTNLNSYYSTATTSTRAFTIAQRDGGGNLHANVFYGVASSAYYADLAERYHTDQEYGPGTVVVIGGESEITASNEPAQTSVLGVVSTNPAVMMNSEAGPDHTHPFIALRGRVPCKVEGPIKKGDMLVTSESLGRARAYCANDNCLAVFAKALQDNTDSYNVIEVVII